jgi:ubiquinone/menaquinone biosynthesis C-methylase UbiE
MFDRKFIYSFIAFLVASSLHASNTYILETGEKAKERLDIQSDIFDDTFDQHLQQAGLDKNHVVWDLGCGTGSALPKLANMAKKVIAIDISKEQLDQVEQKIEREHLSNVAIFTADVLNESTLPLEKPDFTYARFLFMHLNDRERALKNIFNSLKDGGIFLSQESIISSLYTDPKHEEFEKLNQNFIRLSECKGNDCDVGKSIKKYCHNAGFIQVTSEEIQHTVSSNLGAKVKSGSLNEAREHFLSNKILTVKQIEDFQKLMENFANNYPELKIHFLQVYSIAKKPTLKD